jgi:hypothetical protein
VTHELDVPQVADALASAQGQRRAAGVLWRADGAPEVPAGSARDEAEADLGIERAGQTTTSLAVPSPPTATTSRDPAATASPARTAPSPRRRVKAHPKSPTTSRMARAMASNLRPVRPLALAGLTMRWGRRTDVR